MNPSGRLLLVGGLAALLTSCGLGETSAGDVQSGPAGPDAVRVVMEDNVFEPEVLEVPANSQVTIEVRNEGQENHNLTIEELETSTGPMETGDVMTVRFNAPSGTTDFLCTWHSEMVGRIEAT
jgi:plastocyanin